jgi:ABC-type amino acid transport substrate-binding protein
MRKPIIALLTAVVMAVSAPVAGTLAASTPVAGAPVTLYPGQLTVGVSLPSEGFETGIANGSHVIYAHGFDIDLAQDIANRLGFRRVQFVQSSFSTLLTAGKKPWDIAVAQITITAARSRNLTFSQPYMTVDQGVLGTQGLSPVPTSLAGLRPLQLCALRGSTGADVIKTRISPYKSVLLPVSVPTLLLDLQSGACQAVVYDAPSLGAMKSLAPGYYGPFVGLIPTAEHYGVAMSKGSPLAGPVDAALGALIAGGTVQQLENKWLTTDLAKLPILR